jgi:hypothetical protein
MPKIFRFSIRDLLWLTIVAAVFCSWWLDHRRQAQEHAGAIQGHAQAIAEKTKALAVAKKEVSLLNQIVQSQTSVIKTREAELRDSLKRREEVANALRIIRGEQSQEDSPQK